MFFLCQQDGCDKVFNCKRGLKEHERTHQINRPYHCPNCDQNFTQYSSLQKHERVHDKQKPFKCEHPGCKLAFSQVSNLIRHQRIHSGEKPFECHICQKKFASGSNLKQHIQIHDATSEGRINYNCIFPKCNHSYLYQSSLKKHYQVSHSKDYNKLIKEQNIQSQGYNIKEETVKQRKNAKNKKLESQTLLMKGIQQVQQLNKQQMIKSLTQKSKSKRNSSSPNLSLKKQKLSAGKSDLVDIDSDIVVRIAIEEIQQKSLTQQLDDLLKMPSLNKKVENSRIVEQPQKTTNITEIYKQQQQQIQKTSNSKEEENEQSSPSVFKFMTIPEIDAAPAAAPNNTQVPSQPRIEKLQFNSVPIPLEQHQIPQEQHQFVTSFKNCNIIIAPERNGGGCGSSIKRRSEGNVSSPVQPKQNLKMQSCAINNIIKRLQSTTVGIQRQQSTTNLSNGNEANLKISSHIPAIQPVQLLQNGNKQQSENLKEKFVNQKRLTLKIGQETGTTQNDKLSVLTPQDIKNIEKILQYSRNNIKEPSSEMKLPHQQSAFKKGYLLNPLDHFQSPDIRQPPSLNSYGQQNEIQSSILYSAINKQNRLLKLISTQQQQQIQATQQMSLVASQQQQRIVGGGPESNIIVGASQQTHPPRAEMQNSKGSGDRDSQIIGGLVNQSSAQKCVVNTGSAGLNLIIRGQNQHSAPRTINRPSMVAINPILRNIPSESSIRSIMSKTPLPLYYGERQSPLARPSLGQGGMHLNMVLKTVKTESSASPGVPVLKKQFQQ